MTRTISFLTSGAALFLLLAACSGSDGSEGGGGACAEYANALVSYAERCSDGAASLGYERARFEAACARALAAPGVTNLAGQIAACSKKISSATSCDGEELSCEDLTGGTLEDGAACADGYQCKGGACLTEANSNCGKCAARAPIGGKCTRSSDCVEGASCNATSDTGKCVAIKIAKAGEECFGSGDEDVRCDKGLRCSFGAGKATCKAPGGAGSDCTSRSDCSGDLRCVDKKCATGLGEGAACSGFDECAKGLDCGTDKKCARIVYVKAGETCDLTHRCERGSCKGSSITGNPDGIEVTPGKCVDPLPDGAACTVDGPEDAPGCDVFADCTGGKCTLVDPAQCK